jgi:hypothetical protein
MLVWLNVQWMTVETCKKHDWIIGRRWFQLGRPAGTLRNLDKKTAVMIHLAQQPGQSTSNTDVWSVGEWHECCEQWKGY